MPLELYHLHLSQSERIVWLLEEMQIPYELRVFYRDPTTGLGPPELKAIVSLCLLLFSTQSLPPQPPTPSPFPCIPRPILPSTMSYHCHYLTPPPPPSSSQKNPTGTAPYFRDTDVSPPVSLSESTAIAAYLLAVYGPRAAGPRLDRAPGDPDYAAYLEWFHFANGSLQASMTRQMTVSVAVLAAAAATAAADQDGSGSGSVGAGAVVLQRGRARLETQIRLMDEQLGRTGAWLAGGADGDKSGDGLTAADCMAVFSLTTMRGFMPLDLAPYPHVLRWLRDVAARPAYRRALERADGGMEPMVGPTARRFTEFAGLRAVLDKVRD